MSYLLAIVAAFSLLSGQEQTTTIDHDLPAYWRGEEGWRVFSYPDEAMCDIGFPTPSGEYVTVGYHPVDRRVNLLVTNRHATSLRVGETRSLIVGFLLGATPESAITNFATFRVVDAGGQRALSALSTYAAFLDDFARARIMFVMTPSHAIVSAIPLTGSAEAARQVRACAMEAAHLDPNDPFLPRSGRR